MAQDFFLFPLSFAQQQLWLLDQLVPGSPVYNLPGSIHFKGELDVKALERSLNEILRRHEILRTSFRTFDGQPKQIVTPARPLTLPVTSLQDLPVNEREMEAQRLSVEEGGRSFNLAFDALLRVRLLRLAEDEHVLLLTSHHIVSDGWSLGVFLRELAALYEAFMRGKPSPLPELAIQYGDFAVWQRDSLRDELLESHLDYWKQQLAGDRPLLELPFDHSRPAMQTPNGARQKLSLGKLLTTALKALSNEEGTTLFTVLLTAFKILLRRYAGETDIIVGTPISGRNQTETENLIGLFVNTLVLRTDLSGDPDFRETLRRVKEVSFVAYEHQEVPFEKLVEELQPERDLSRMPLFQVMFAFQNVPMPSLELPGVSLKLLDVDISTAKFDLTLNLIESIDGLNGYFEYNSDLFEASTIAALSEHFQTLLHSIVANPRQSVVELPLLTEPEQHQLLYELNDTGKQYPSLCIHELFDQQVERTPEAVAVIFEGEELSYRELNSRAISLALRLRQLGVGPEVLVGILMERSIEMVVGLLGVLKSGGAYVPLDPEYPMERLSFMLADSQAAVVLTQSHLVERLPAHDVRVVCMDSDEGAVLEGNTLLDAQVSPQNLAYIIYTSGSTGQPKGMMLPHSGVVNCLLWMQDTFQLSSDDRVMLKASLSFDASVWELFWPLAVGACVVVARPGGQQDGAYLIDEVIRHDISTIHFVPSMLPLFLERRELGEASCLKRVICGGEALPVSSLEQFFTRSRAALHNFYGPTETTIGSTDWNCERGFERPTVPIGRPISNTETYILDNSLQAMPVGVTGELYIGGAGVGRGYFSRPELTAESFIPHPFSGEAGTRLYRTGDLARYLPDGNIEFLGRRDEQVKIRGFRIELGEIEAVLRRHPLVEECVTLGSEDAAGEKRLVAYIVPRADSAPTVTELRRHLQERLPDYMIPRNFITLAELPLTPSGKLDRRALPDVDQTRPELAQGYVAPSTVTEELLCGIWCNVLKLEGIGIHDNFFDLGGHSLLATQVMAQLQEVFGIEVALRRLFEFPTIAGLAATIEKERGTGESLRALPIKRLPRSDKLPLSFAQQRLWFLSQLAPDNPFYNMTAAVRLSGRLNDTALERALNEVFRRHEALRTNFVVVNRQPRQVIAEPYALELPVLDLSGLSKAEREAEVERRADAEAAKPFDLTRDRLLRLNLLRLSDQEHVLLITLHHIIGDGWSVGVLISEVVALYRAFSSGFNSPLPELPVQYADYAQWQRQWLQGEVLEEQLLYWKQQLEGIPRMMLPTDRPRPLVQTFGGAVHSISWPAELTAALNALSRRAGATLFMTLLAAFKVQLHRYTGQSDVVVGTHIANRHRVEVKDLIGFFVNTLVFRTSLFPEMTFVEVLRSVRDDALGAYAHQDLPFERLVEELQPERDLSRQPLFQIAFVFQNAPRPEMELPGLKLSLLDVHNHTAKFDLGLELWESAAGLNARFEYDTDLFDAETVARMAEHFRVLLEGIVANPEHRIAELPMLSEIERQQLLHEFNDTRREYPALCLHELFEAQVRRTPDAVALRFENGLLSYRELNRKANQLARYLRSIGVGAESLVGIMVERSVQMAISVLAVLKTGGAYVPLDAEYPRERLSFMLRDSRSRVLLTQDHLLSQIGALDPFVADQVQVVRVDEDWEKISEQSGENVDSGATLDNLAYVIYTSGSTGRPKGAMLPHRGIVNCLHWMQDTYQLDNSDIFLLKTSLNFDPSVWELLWPLTIGASVLIAPARSQDSAALVQLMADHQVTTAYFVPSLLTLILEEPRLAECVALKQVICGGESLPLPTLQRFFELSTAELHHSYGPTETSIAATEWTCAADTKHLRAPIGKPLANTRLYVLDENLQLAPRGVVGELYIGGDAVGRGYFARADLTAERYVPDAYRHESGARLYRTGDKVRYLNDGNLEFVGRVDEQVKVRGYRIEPGEIEAVLQVQEGVRDCAVACTGAGEARRLVAYVVADTPRYSGSADLQAEQLVQWSTVFDQIYQQAPAHDDATFNITGWKSAYNGLPIPDDEMQEWVDSAVEQILSLRPQRVLEIGCGSGLLLFRIAPHCKEYLGTDFSEIVLRQLRQQVSKRLPNLPPDSLMHREADDFEGLHGFDVVILNSVVQYFPNIDYLMNVLKKAVNALAEGGHIYVGDVRSRPLQELFYTSVELARAKSSLPVADLRRRVQKRMAEEEELVIDPSFFVALQDYLPRIAQVEIVPKRGRYHNELTRFRYEVIIHVRSKGDQPKDFTWNDWQQEGPTLAGLRSLLSEKKPGVLAFAGVANARLSAAAELVETLARMEGTRPASELKELLPPNGKSGIDPEDLWQLGGEFPYSVHLSWARHNEAGSYDLVLSRRAGAELESLAIPSAPTDAVNRKAWSEYANDPLRGKYAGVFARQLRERLKETLPDYMIPGSFIMLDELPLTPSGKLDRRALPEPDGSRPELAQGYVAPRTTTEELLCGIWAGVLRLERVGIADNFFDLGGHSLLATQVVAQLREVFGLEIALRRLFEFPTVAELSRHIEGEAAGRPQAQPPTIKPCGRNGSLPLSFAQQRLWFLDQLAPNNAAYNIATAVRLVGQLDLPALKQTFTELLRRHESLRTGFGVVDSQAVQVVSESLPFDLRLSDLSHLAEIEREQEAQRLTREETDSPFDLRHAPLLRGRLLRLAQDEHVLLVTMHHIVSDGWSIGVLVREVSALYEAFSSGNASPLRELPIQYGDYAVWQRDWLQGSVLEEQLDYWREQLRGTPAVLELPTDHSRPAAQSYRGGVVKIQLDTFTTQALRSLSQTEGVTLFMLLLAAFDVLLWRWSGEADLVVGTAIANRTRAELENLIGFFANTLALRVSLAGNPTFTELVKRVKEVALEAYAHQELPFEKLVEDLQPKREMSHSPLFQVMMVLQNAPRTELQLPGLTLSSLEVNNRTSKFDLTLLLEEQDDCVRGLFEYNADLFDEATVQRMAGHFQTLLDGIVADANRSISELPLLTQPELEQLIQWNETQASYPNQSSHQIFEEQVARTPEAIALVFADEQLSYRELNRRANQLAHYLQRLGVGPEKLVGICMERSVEMIVSLLAVLKAGGAYVPLDPEYPRERLSFMLADAAVRVLLTQERLLGLVASDDARVVCVDREWEAIASERTENPESSVNEQNLAYVIYTSGSTGLPKGVALQHRPLFNLIEWQHSGLKLSLAARTLQVSSLSFDASFNESFATWRSGGTLILISEELRRDPDGLLRFIAEQKVQRLFLPFVTLQQLAEAFAAGGRLPETLREILSTAEQLHISQSIAHLFQQLEDCTLYNEYGPSESHVVTAFTLTGPPESWSALPPIGVPVANTQIYLLDRELRPVPVGVSGELYIAGVHLARGYLNQPGITAEKFIPNPFGDETGTRLYKTGDLARYLPDGNIKYLGRIDNQVKVHGFRIELGEIEAVLAEHEQVQEAVVIARAAAGDTRLVAYVIAPEAQAPPSARELRAHLKKKLPDYMVPSIFVRLDEMPLTPSGKFDRRALPEPAQLRPEIEPEFVAPRTPAEELLAEMWARVLKLERIGIHDNFFELGGHSLLATQLISQVRKVFRVELPLRVLFEEPTVSGLLKEIARAWGGMETVEEIARTLKEIDELSEETVKKLLAGQ
jgi:amino acid adenylation domain-containing protein